MKQEKHSLWLRILHWNNVPLLCLMIWSGVLIYWANDVYPGFFPRWFYQTFNLDSRLADGMAAHFLVGWLFIGNGLLYLIGLFVSGHWRELFPDRSTPGQIVPTILHDMGLLKTAPPQGKFNAMQRLTYTGVIGLGFIAVLSGFAIYKPMQLSWLAALFGGYQGARLVHFIAMISFCAFIFVHLVQVVRAGWNDFRAMVGRTLFSFAVLIGGLACVVGLWFWISGMPGAGEEDTSPVFRQVLEVNGKIWKNLFRQEHLSMCTPPAAGKIPRTNGDIGLEKPVNLEQWHLEIIADDQDPQARHISLTMKDIAALPHTETATEFKCIEGWSEDMAFAGVKFSDLMNVYHLSPKAYVGLATEDGAYYVSIDMESMRHAQTLLAYAMNGRPLLPENGAPLRLVIPVKYGIKNIKRIGRIFLSNRRPPDYWAERGYDWYAGL